MTTRKKKTPSTTHADRQRAVDEWNAAAALAYSAAVTAFERQLPSALASPQIDQIASMVTAAYPRVEARVSYVNGARQLSFLPPVVGFDWGRVLVRWDCDAAAGYSGPTSCRPEELRALGSS